jgi:uncharacterized protein YlbG (UPF0298 family)
VCVCVCVYIYIYKRKTQDYTFGVPLFLLKKHSIMLLYFNKKNI